MLIRNATLSDLDAIAAVEAACFPASEAADTDAFAQRLTHYADHFWLLFDGGRLVSFVDGFVTDEPDLRDEMYADAALHDPDGQWQMIFGVNTLPQYRNQGCAARLMERAIADAKAQNRRGLVLTCKDALVHWYARFGFRDEGISSASTHGGAVWHQMRLTFRNILVLFPCSGDQRLQLEQACGNTGRLCFQRSAEALRAAHVIIGEPTRAEFALCENLEWMQSPSSGVNYCLDVFPSGAMLTCATGAYGSVIAEHMLAMTLALCRRLPEYRDQQHRGCWQLLRHDKPLEGSTVLILGAGDIGTTLAAWLRPMVGRIIGVRRVPRAHPPCFDEMITPDQLDDRLGEADLILCALPHTPQTIHLLDRSRLERMKPDAVLVNGGRGSLIDQDALCDLLDQGRFYGVGLEVADPEPLPENHSLWHKDRVLITPHAAGNSFAPGSPTHRKIWDIIIANVRRYFSGLAPVNQVDFASGYRRTAEKD